MISRPGSRRSGHCVPRSADDDPFAPTPLGVQPRLLAILTSGASAAVSLLFGLDAWTVLQAADAELLARYSGQAVEDILGLGWWPTWVVVGLVQTAVLGIAFHCLSPARRRIVVALLLATFAVASVLGYLSFEREHALVFRES